MKRCPECQVAYSDETLAFCLDDGVMLIFESDNSLKTLQLPPNSLTDEIQKGTDYDVQPPINQPNITGRGVSRAWIYSTICLLILFLSGGIGTWLWLTNSPNDVKIKSSDSPAPSDERQLKVQNSPPLQPSPEAASNRAPIPKENEPRPQSPSPLQTPPEIDYRVVGVVSGDVLYLRPGPGNLKSSLAKIPPNTTGLKVVGAGVRSGKALWYPIVYDGIRGWVNGKFIAKQ